MKTQTTPNLNNENMLKALQEFRRSVPTDSSEYRAADGMIEVWIGMATTVRVEDFAKLRPSQRQKLTQVFQPNIERLLV